MTDKITIERETLEQFRDDVLHQRGPLAENGMTSDQVNDVLGLFDDAFCAALAAQPAEPVARVVPYGATVKLIWEDTAAAHNCKPGPLYAAPPAPAAVPPGWKLVPIEPTRAMIASGAVALMKASHSDIDPTMEEVTAAYRAMTAAVKPATAVPLTDERIVELFRETFLAHTDPLGKDNMTIAFARAIERAHSIAAGDKLCGG